MTSVHGDSSSFYVHGQYESDEGEAQTKYEPDLRPIEIKRGYSRDHRPDLKQFTLNLLTSTVMNLYESINSVASVAKSKLYNCTLANRIWYY